MKNRLRAFALGTAVVLGPSVAHAQQSSSDATSTPPRDRTAQIPAQASADDRSFIDEARDWMKDTQIIERLDGDIDGWYPRLGGITRGSGFALGPGYRTHVFDDRVLLDASASFSMKLYKALDLRARWIQTWNRRAELWTEYRLEDFPQEHFYGVGSDTTPATRTSYDLHGSDLRIRGELKPTRWLNVGLIAGYLKPRIGSGEAPEFPSIEEVFTDAGVPGLAVQPNFIHTELSVDVDYRNNHGNPQTGGFYRARYGVWNDHTLNRYDFQRFDGEVNQYLPLTTDRKHGVSAHGAVSFVNNAPGNQVPFYVLPYIGGQDTVRSYREFRFRDENALSFGGQYRWTPIQWVSGVAFADFGKVSHNWQDITLADMKHGFGFGVHVHSQTQTFATLEFGFGGGEGWRTFLTLGAF